MTVYKNYIISAHGEIDDDNIKLPRGMRVIMLCKNQLCPANARYNYELIKMSMMNIDNDLKNISQYISRKKLSSYQYNACIYSGNIDEKFNDSLTLLGCANKNINYIPNLRFQKESNLKFIDGLFELPVKVEIMNEKGNIIEESSEIHKDYETLNFNDILKKPSGVLILPEQYQWFKNELWIKIKYLSEYYTFHSDKEPEYKSLNEYDITDLKSLINFLYNKNKNIIGHITTIIVYTCVSSENVYRKNSCMFNAINYKENILSYKNNGELCNTTLFNYDDRIANNIIDTSNCNIIKINVEMPNSLNNSKMKKYLQIVDKFYSEIENNQLINKTLEYIEHKSNMINYDELKKLHNNYMQHLKEFEDSQMEINLYFNSDKELNNEIFDKIIIGYLDPSTVLNNVYSQNYIYKLSILINSFILPYYDINDKSNIFKYKFLIFNNENRIKIINSINEPALYYMENLNAKQIKCMMLEKSDYWKNLPTFDDGKFYTEIYLNIIFHATKYSYKPYFEFMQRLLTNIHWQGYKKIYAINDKSNVIIYDKNKEGTLCNKIPNTEDLVRLEYIYITQNEFSKLKTYSDYTNYIRNNMFKELKYKYYEIELINNMKGGYYDKYQKYKIKYLSLKDKINSKN